MYKDPLLNWPGSFPYDILAPTGLTPDSPMSVVRETSFVLMEKGLMTPEARQAWEDLRRIRRRLLVDFFLYSADAPAVSRPAPQTGSTPGLSNSEQPR